MSNALEDEDLSATRAALDMEARFLITDPGEKVALLTPAPGRAPAVDQPIAERRAKRGRGSLLDVLEQLPASIPASPSGEILDELRSGRM